MIDGLETRLAAAVRLAHSMGDITLKHLNTEGLVTDTKADGTIVTEADRAAETRGREIITRQFGDDGLLGDPDFQAASETKTGTAQAPYIIDWRNTRSAMQHIGLGKGSTKNLPWPSLQSIAKALSLLPEQFSGAIDARKWHCIYIHSSNLTNYKCLGPAGSSSIRAKIPAHAGHGGVIVHHTQWSYPGLCTVWRHHYANAVL